MSNKGRVQKTLGFEIPNPRGLVGRSGHRVVALEMDSVDCIGVAIFQVIWMRQLELSVFVEAPRRAGVERHGGVAVYISECKSVDGRGQFDYYKRLLILMSCNKGYARSSRSAFCLIVDSRQQDSNW